LVGPSGCGKTTLLRLVAGLTPPTGGSVSFPAGASRLGFVFQNGAMLPWRTVTGNIGLPLELAGCGRDAIHRRVRDLVALVGLEGFEHAYPRQLSGGMQQRAALALALANSPAVLLLDEPLGALDALSRERMQQELQRVWLSTGKTVLMVTHSIEEAVLLSDRVVVLSHRPGRVRDVVPVSLPRPREPAVRYSSEFGSVAGRVRSVIEEAERANGAPAPAH
jgi:NitT/TauT family transport system ATP-binding protein